MENLPKRLAKDTIMEVIFELRFTSSTNAMANILLGLLVQEFSSDYPSVERLGISEIPAEFVEKNPKLRYAHHYKLVGANYALHIGENVVSVSCKRPYRGWDDYKAKINELLDFIKNTTLIDKPERFSLKYTNVVPTENDTSLDDFRAEVSLGEFDCSNYSLGLRAEITLDGFQNLIQLTTGVNASIAGGEEIKGVVFDIDTIHMGGYKDFWKEIPDLLENCHKTEKKVFFGLLQPETIKRLEPIT